MKSILLTSTILFVSMQICFAQFGSRMSNWKTAPNSSPPGASVHIDDYFFYGRQENIEIYTNQDKETGVVYIKFYNEEKKTIKGTISVKWYEKDGQVCSGANNEEESTFWAKPGISGGRSEGEFYSSYRICNSKGPDCKFEINLTVNE